MVSSSGSASAASVGSRLSQVPKLNSASFEKDAGLDFSRLRHEFFRNNNIYANTYADTSKRLRGFLHLMSIWKGSVFRLIWHDLLLFLLGYAIISIVYRLVLLKHPYYRQIFELACIYCNKYRTLIPITFLTGFYVTQVVTRYWTQYMSLPRPDKLALKLVSYIPGQDLFNRKLRRTVMRQVNLSIVLVLRLVSQKVYKRFPSYDSLVAAKLMLRHEAERLIRIEQETPHEATWAPLLWALKLIQRARSEKKIVLEPPIYANLVSSFEFIEESNRTILNYGWVNFPLAYTQVATLSVFSYLMASLMGSQYLIPEGENRDEVSFPNVSIPFANKAPFDAHTPDFWLPCFTVLEFIAYMGWIKVAETLLNPFGDDDEDFQTNYLIDRNVQVSYMIVDGAEMQFEQIKDPFMEAGISVPSELPYFNAHRDNSSIRANINDDFRHKRRGSLKQGLRRLPKFLNKENARMTMPELTGVNRQAYVESVITTSTNEDSGINEDDSSSCNGQQSSVDGEGSVNQNPSV